VIGWNSTQARDADEAIANGLCDEDLDGLEASVTRRRDAIKYPACPSCGEALKVPHFHGEYKVERIALMPEDDRAAPPSDLMDRWSTLVKTVIDAMAPPNERRTK
jgi:hypothetical protein